MFPARIWMRFSAWKSGACSCLAAVRRAVEEGRAERPRNARHSQRHHGHQRRLPGTDRRLAAAARRDRQVEPGDRRLAFPAPAADGRGPRVGIARREAGLARGQGERPCAASVQRSSRSSHVALRGGCAADRLRRRARGDLSPGRSARRHAQSRGPRQPAAARERSRARTPQPARQAGHLFDRRRWPSRNPFETGRPQPRAGRRSTPVWQHGLSPQRVARRRGVAGRHHARRAGDAGEQALDRHSRGLANHGRHLDGTRLVEAGGRRAAETGHARTGVSSAVYRQANDPVSRRVAAGSRPSVARRIAQDRRRDRPPGTHRDRLAAGLEAADRLDDQSAAPIAARCDSGRHGRSRLDAPVAADERCRR